MPFSPDILIVAGEASGDLHGTRLVQALKAAAPACRIFGIGGDGMAGAGMELLFHIRDMAVVGFSEVIRHLPFLRKVMAALLAEVERRRPAVVILIDYPGFNLRLAQRLRPRGCKILYYIAPQVWAWGGNRIAKMAKLVDEMAVVFPFEAPLFANAGLRTHFVGHPLLEGLSPRLSRREFLAAHGFVEGRPLLGLLPGSRHHEIVRLLPDMIATARILQQQHPGLQIAVAQAPTLPARLYQEIIPNGDVRLLAGTTYELMRDSTACLVCSGTATLETACFGTPLAIVYRVSRLSYAIGKRLVKLPYIGLVNVVAGRLIAPEFVQQAFQPQRVAGALSPYLQPTPERAAICRALQQVRERLGTPGASQRTAAIALRLAGAGENLMPRPVTAA
ncbi:MAG: lipid-A-disaccharide synthase [candidate division KSB1 bacterium]|nr:lipid-A-disaccharide synthase [candidate division KSB1 bacterium]MDZ7274547.1 lipid-A-disaccharide synthase [candidate division KSB1 bacterium]MDZ7284792.1 lipid-A-disaccharide synthase [candidate division KSB1 bacterium]MDZ7297788.1 lipid-A-disaccharide synthase [candidate division KSB1 bacterium]MDZ7306423.1 lipid-A-disaccharide synthase [candidate division KSB1 bacterium]